MTDQDALLAAVLANPEDDTPRLVFADWLEEHDEPERAEFIRVQCELARMRANPDDGCSWGKSDHEGHSGADPKRDPCPRCWPGSIALRRRERELLQGGPIGDANWMQWFGSPLPDGAVCDNLNHERTPSGFRFTFRRGFVSSISLTLAQFLGGPCERCDGEGRIEQVADYIGGWERYETASCPVCKSDPDYRTPGLAGALFAAAPIEEVRLTDREPLRVSPDHRFQWTRVSVGDGQLVTPYDLPPELFDLLEGWVEYDPGDPDDHLPFKTFSTRAAALAALSAACVAYGRANAAGCWHGEGCGECGATGQIRPAFEWIRCPACSGSGTVRVPGLPPLSTRQAGGPAPR